MYHDLLQEAQAEFLRVYPGGFSDPGMQKVRKKHNVDALIAYTQPTLTQANFNRHEFITDAIVKIVSRSSMVSRFEKPRFRDFVRSLSSIEKRDLADSYEQRLFGRTARRKSQGFEMLVGMLAHHKIATWSVVSAVPFYFAPHREVFVKPTTVKRIIRFLGAEHLEYRARPSWEFYQGFRKLMTDVKKAVHPSLAPNNAALSGFLMMTFERAHSEEGGAFPKEDAGYRRDPS